MRSLGDPNGRDERLDQFPLVTDHGEDRAIVIGVAVDVEQPRVDGELVRDRVDRPLVATLAEVRYGLEQSHVTTLGVLKEYYDNRAAEYDDWYLGTGPLRRA